MNFKSHINYLRQTCSKKLNLLKVLSNTSWGADSSSMLKIYCSIIRSKLDYGSVIYMSARKSVLRYLDCIHHEGIRIATGAFRTSPIKSLYALHQEPSLHIRRCKLALNHYFHIKSHIQHPLYSKILKPDHEMLFSHRPTSIPTFGLKIKQLLSTLKN